MSEAAIERKLVEKIRKIGGIAYKFVSPDNPGVPDRLIILPDGRIVFVELKSSFGRLAKLQAWQISRMKELGCDVRVLHGVDDVDRFISEVSG